MSSPMRTSFIRIMTIQHFASFIKKNSFILSFRPRDRFYLSKMILIVVNYIKLNHYHPNHCLTDCLAVTQLRINRWLRIRTIGDFKIWIRFLCSNKYFIGNLLISSSRWLMILKAGLVAVFQQKPQVANSSCCRVGCLFLPPRLPPILIDFCTHVISRNQGLRSKDSQIVFQKCCLSVWYSEY